MNILDFGMPQKHVLNGRMAIESGREVGGGGEGPVPLGRQARRNRPAADMTAGLPQRKEEKE